MKKPVLFYTLFTFIFLTMNLTHIKAQFPDFIRVDTGAIYESKGSLARFSGILFDIDNDGDFDPVISSKNAIGINAFPLTSYKNERNGLYIQNRVFLPEYSNAFRVFHPSPMGDVDNDGDIDVVGIDDKKLGVFLNDGYGNFLSDSSYIVQNNFGSSYPVLIDWNKDGYLDILFIDSYTEVFYNNGQGIFSERDTICIINRPTTDWLHSMALGDADNDGDMDVYCGFSRGIEKNAFYINTGDSLEPIDPNHIILSDTSMTTSVNWVDYDNDGDMDLSVMSEDPDTINGVLPALYENLGNLEFEKHIVVEEMYRGSFTISDYWADLDNDGDQDLFISLEDGPFPLSGPYEGLYSPTPYNILYLNEGNGQFTNLLNHTLTLGEGHTAKIFDHDNDGDLDVLTIGNAYDRYGHNYLYINEGNNNSFISISFVDKFNCTTPYGTRVQVKAMINGEFVSQTRELSLIDGNVSFQHTPEHFGIGEADVVDSLIIKWPSGHVDTYLNVEANQFYRATENDKLEIDFKATNYIQYNPVIADIEFMQGETSSIDLKDHYQFIMGDTVPEISGDTLNFEIVNENSDIVTANLDGNIITLVAGDTIGNSKVQVVVTTGFTHRMDYFTVTRGTSNISDYMPEQSLRIYPNPFTTATTILYELQQPDNVSLSIYNHLGQIVYQTQANQQPGNQQLNWNAESYAEGVYYYRLHIGDEVATGKLIKVK